jgi:hypothetical protein
VCVKGRMRSKPVLGVMQPERRGAVRDYYGGAEAAIVVSPTLVRCLRKERNRTRLAWLVTPSEGRQSRDGKIERESKKRQKDELERAKNYGAATNTTAAEAWKGIPQQIFTWLNNRELIKAGSW